MRWEDERYVRFYTRDTPEFLALSWQARGLFGLIMRRVDRAGVMPVGKLGLRGVAVSVGGPWTEIESPLRELVDDGCIVFSEQLAAVLVPNFVEAQECSQSDKARKAASRERARAKFGGSTAASEVARSVTDRDDSESRIVTESHDRSHAVTRGHSVLCRAVPYRAVLEGGAGGPAPDADGAASSLPGIEDAPREKTSRKRGGRLARTAIPKDWQPTPEHAKYVRVHGLDVDGVVEDFRNHWLGEGKLMANWNATFKSNVDRILRTPWLLDRWRRADADEPDEVASTTVHGPPAPPPAGLLERLEATRKPTVRSPMLRELLAEDAVRGADVKLGSTGEGTR